MSATSVRYRIRHETTYEYAGEVAHSHQALHLTPRSFERQRCLSHAIEVAPRPAVCNEHLDAFGNAVTRFELDRPHDRLDVVADMEVALHAHPPPAALECEDWERVRDKLRYTARPRAAEWLDPLRFRAESPYVRIKRVFGEFARDCFVPGSSVLTVADALMAKIYADFTYAPGETQIATPLLEVLQTRRGVCQDYAHLMIACLRTSGLAARYVSGYLHTCAAPADAAPARIEAATTAAAVTEAIVDENAAMVQGQVVDRPSAAEDDAPKLVGADASHAWVAVFAPPYGWVEFDPTNNLRVTMGHVALAWGRDFGDVSPLRGVILGGGQHVLTVRVAVAPLAA